MHKVITRYRQTGRMRRVVFGAAATLLLATNTLSPLLVPTAHADAASFLGSINNKYYSAIFLRDCLAQMQDKKSIRGDYATIFAEGGTANRGVYIGRWLAPDSGELSCSDASSVNSAASNLGYATPGDYLRAIGYTTTTGHQDPVCTGNYPGPNICSEAREYTIYVISGDDKAQDIIKKNQQITAARFYAYLTIFTKNCTIHIPPNSGDDTVTQTQLVKDGDAFKTQDVQVGFTPSSVGTGQYDTSIGGAKKSIQKYDYNGQNTTCGELLTAMNDVAKDVNDWNNKNKDNAVTTADATEKAVDKQSCADNGGTWDEETSMCQGSTQASCVGGALGWLLCPIVTVMDNLNKSMANSIESMLRVSMMTEKEPRKALQEIWSLLVGIANLLLVVAFLIVIFSQATSVGLSAYGIKKMLPRIIAAAILINLSFFICGVLVDIFNIIGGAVKGIIDVGMTQLPDSENATVKTTDIVNQIGAWILTLSGALVALTALAFLGLIAFVLPIIVTGTMATLGFFVGIAIRQVLIVLLIIIAPVAIAAMILPNTEPLFKKWWSSLLKLLAMYPIIMAIIYGCTLVAKIILAGT